MGKTAKLFSQCSMLKVWNIQNYNFGCGSAIVHGSRVISTIRSCYQATTSADMAGWEELMCAVNICGVAKNSEKGCNHL
jgi:hypothetical protein